MSGSGADDLFTVPPRIWWQQIGRYRHRQNVVTKMAPEVRERFEEAARAGLPMPEVYRACGIKRVHGDSRVRLKQYAAQVRALANVVAPCMCGRVWGHSGGCRGVSYQKKGHADAGVGVAARA